MKKWFFITAITIAVFTSCTKTSNTDCTIAAPTAVAADSQKVYLQNYLAANNITNATEKNGMFYVINTQGTGVSPNICSSIGLTYIGNLINGTTDGAVFDSSTPGSVSQFTLSSLITGWQTVLPLVKAGGTVTLYIPPALGYGANAQGSSIPANSYLKFRISLLGVY
ncbi:MAG: FKBP-type peptidyl-prolyl cis-trans isomerase [Ferruginibacter sp.]|nr:FKBP-type peptidylprolyl isomerase [Ferruginibacter sp.]